MRDRLGEALKRSKADYTEIRIEERESTRVAYRGKTLEAAGSNTDVGGFVRCLAKDRGWGTASFNSLDDLDAMVERAWTCARLGKADSPIELAQAARVDATVRSDLGEDFRLVPLSEKKALVERYNRSMLGYGGKIADTRAVYSDSFTRISLANSEGSYVEQEKPAIGLAAVAIARDGDDVEEANQVFAGPRGFDYVSGRDAQVEEAAKRAIALLSAKGVGAGRYTVIADPTLAGVFIHEAFGHLSEADFVCDNPGAREMMTLGRRFGSAELGVFDDGSLGAERGATIYDDEGVPGRRTWLIRGGDLVGRLHSRATAAAMGEEATGNARAVGYRFAPIVRMTNTAIAKGSASFEDMIKDIDLGIYACDAFGGETALEHFSFSAGYAYMIRDGQIAEMVKNVVLAGNLFSTLANIDKVGDDFRWLESGGGCGKAGQFPLPTGMGAPHIRIRDVVVGGE